MPEITAAIPVDISMLLIIKIVQILAAIVMVVGLVISIWSFLLLRREVIKQNKRIIELLENIENVLKK